VTAAVQRVDTLLATDALFAAAVWDVARRLDAEQATALRRTMIRRAA